LPKAPAAGLTTTYWQEKGIERIRKPKNLDIKAGCHL
jgi:hypothetical protein